MVILKSMIALLEFLFRKGQVAHLYEKFVQLKDLLRQNTEHHSY